MSDVTQLDEAQVLAHRDAALGQMKFNRTYLKGMLEKVPKELWTTIPAEPQAISLASWSYCRRSVWFALVSPARSRRGGRPAHAGLVAEKFWAWLAGFGGCDLQSDR